MTQPAAHPAECGIDALVEGAYWQWNAYEWIP